MTSPAETIATLKIKLFWEQHKVRDAQDKWEACQERVEKIKAQIAVLEANNCVPLPDYWGMLKDHDWSITDSTDHDLHKRRKDRMNALADIGMQSCDHAALYDAMWRWAYAGGSLPPPPELEAQQITEART